MLQEIIQSFWFLLPAGAANMAPVLFNRINFLNHPIDFNKTINKQPIFGENKTWRGLFFGVITAILVIYLQSLLFPYMRNYSIVNYHYNEIWFLGFLLGFGALFGDLVKSFFKRRFNIQPGKPWIVFDQIDWIIGALIFASFYIPITFNIWLTSIILFLLLHPLVNYIGYLLKIKKSKI